MYEYIKKENMMKLRNYFSIGNEFAAYIAFVLGRKPGIRPDMKPNNQSDIRLDIRINRRPNIRYIPT